MAEVTRFGGFAVQLLMLCTLAGLGEAAMESVTIDQGGFFFLSRWHKMTCTLGVLNRRHNPATDGHPLTWLHGETKLPSLNTQQQDRYGRATMYTSVYSFTVKELDHGKVLKCETNLPSRFGNSATVTIHVVNSTLCDSNPCGDDGICFTTPEEPNNYSCSYTVPTPDACGNFARCGKDAIGQHYYLGMCHCVFQAGTNFSSLLVHDQSQLRPLPPF